MHLALVNLPQQKMNDFNLKAAEKNITCGKGSALYPTISAFGGLVPVMDISAHLIYTRYLAGIAQADL